MRVGVTPVLIPNTMVKTRAAENTKLATAWEDRWVPDFMMIHHHEGEKWNATLSVIGG